MRVLHVVTLVSDDGAFGGPLRVALNHVAELRRRGHDARVVAGYRGPRPLPPSIDGVPVSLFPVRQALPVGFSGLVAPGMVAWLRRQLPHTDLVHVHAGRDLVTLPALALAERAGCPTVVQTHGMVAPDKRLVAKALDKALTRRLLLSASARLVLTAREQRELPEVLGHATVQRIPNGVPGPTDAPKSGPVTDIVFLARLHARKRPANFIAAALTLGPDHPDVLWSIIGPDEGELSAVLRSIEQNPAASVRYEGALPYAEVAERLARASIYVLPSVDEPFPMSLLEALRAGVPSICTDTCGIAQVLLEREAALVIDNSQEELTAAVQRLIEDQGLRERLSVNAQQAVRDLFGIEAVVDKLEAIYTAAVEGKKGNDLREERRRRRP